MSAGVLRDRFAGRIAGAGGASGVRVVIGRWDQTPLGSFADVMLEEPGGHRVLLAPSTEVAEYISATYTFDEVCIGPVRVNGEQSWELTAPGLELVLAVGSRTVLGYGLRMVPSRVGTSAAWASFADPFARVLLRGVRTRGQARAGRREWYSATDRQAITALSGRWRGTDLGVLGPVDPPCRFGFSSTPRAPGVTRVLTTVERPALG